MKISIVVPAFNEEKLLGRSLECIAAARTAFDCRGWSSEVIVCDNNSTDRTAEIARSAGATVVFEPVNQISRARNRGASAATGDWLVFVDADSYPTVELFGDVAEAIRTGRCLGGGTTVRMEAPRRLVRGLARVWNWLSRTRRWMAGSFVFCPSEAFRELRGFSPELFAAEELDFSQRLKRLARDRGKQLVILHRHPLLTSGRKGELYSTWDFVRLLTRTVWYRGGTLKHREDCHMWYDGRR